MIKAMLKMFFTTFFLCFFGTILYFAVFYHDMYLVTQHCANLISEIVANEGCVASEKIYKNSSGAYSMQDSIATLLKNTSKVNSKPKMQLRLYGNEVSPLGNLVGVNVTFGSSNTSNATVRVSTLDNPGTFLGSYVDAAKKGDVVNIEIYGKVDYRIPFVPDWKKQNSSTKAYVDTKPVAPNQNFLLGKYNYGASSTGRMDSEFDNNLHINIDISATSSCVVLRQAKGVDDNKKGF